MTTNTSRSSRAPRRRASSTNTTAAASTPSPTKRPWVGIGPRDGYTGVRIARAEASGPVLSARCTMLTLSASRGVSMSTEIVVGVLAFLGAGAGAALAYVATRSATKAEREARRREEWGRRFTASLEAITSSDARRRATGRALLVELMRSELATDDDRRDAAAVLTAAATHTDDADLRRIVPTIDNLDDVEIVRDTGDVEPDEEDER